MTSKPDIFQSESPILSRNPTINPYRYALQELWKRLRWDAKPESWRSRKLLTSWHNRFLGQKAVIVCNGPSLVKNDLSLLDNVFTFGLNKINLLFKTSLFRPSCIVSVNRLVIEQNEAFFNQTDIPLFLDYLATDRIKARKNVAFLHSADQYKFAQNCSVSIFQGATVTFVAMQLAFHMGFRQIALIGCDHNFNVKGASNKAVIAEGKDSDHFSPDYFAAGMQWQLPDLAASEASYALAGEVFTAAGGNILNATEGGKLELFPRIPLEDFIRLKV